ncbi:MAG: 3'-5' exonuclease [Gammaproteobacteria bacterium]|nr:3'-5' exonuclease [Gammaproteobacteria bacterium]MDA8007461.1 3'-5' exonuclease [Gammaproteobacteria bacterium]MDA8022208.1 3'-5' exonuclease [Gammaproteobacteria bacterium]
MNPVLAFDIETVPDTAAGARLYGLEGLSDEDIARAMATRRVQQTGGSDFLPLHLHRVVAISAALRSGEDSLRVWSLGEEDSDEAELIARFYDGIERYTPTLVSWNGGGFDLPVLHYRSLLHATPARRYWEMGDGDREFRFNNYLNRFHWRHIDLMDALAGFNPRAFAPLDELAVMLGLPGKLGMHGGDVWRAYLDGGIRQIREYCESDALNTFLIYLRWEAVRGALDREALEREYGLVKKFLRESGRKHFAAFLDAWEKTGGPAEEEE